MHKRIGSVIPGSMKELLLLAVVMTWIVIVFAVVARGPAYRGVVVFWYPWSCYVIAQAVYLARRAILLHRGQQALFVLTDKIILGASYAFAFVALAVLLVSRFAG